MSKDIKQWCEHFTDLHNYSINKVINRLLIINIYVRAAETAEHLVYCETVHTEFVVHKWDTAEVNNGSLYNEQRHLVADFSTATTPCSSSRVGSLSCYVTSQGNNCA